MRLLKATKEDSQRLAKYFKESHLQGPIDLIIDRQDSFFQQYELFSKDYLTYYLINDKDEIKAVASLIFREATVDGEKQIVGYATDLRVSQDRRAILEWSNQFLPALKKERDLRGCKYIFTTVNRYQRQAYNAFIRPRSTKRQELDIFYLENLI